MAEFIKTKTANWLQTKLINRDCGIVFESHFRSGFDDIQSFLECYEQPFQTSIIFYQAFPAESICKFINTLNEELASKLGNSLVNNRRSLLNIIKDAGMKMIVIYDCHLHPPATLEKLLILFSNCQVSVILVGEPEKMAIAQILNHPLVYQWDCLVLDR